MADFQAFAALRYAPAVAGHPDDLVAPPYDVVSPAEARALHERNPYNISRVEYGETLPDDDDDRNRYSRARHEIASWLAAGALQRDAEPRLYIYDQEFEVRGKRIRRRAVFGRLRLEPWDAGVILPHEHTRPRDKADRYQLLRATRVNLSPIMAMYSDPGVTAVMAGDPVDATVFEATLDGEQHTLRTMQSDAAQRLQAALTGQKLYIADGHHRYETALAYRDECRAGAASWSGNEPENFVLAALVDATDPGLVVLPTHRLLRPSKPLDLARLDGLFDVKEMTVGGHEGLSRLMDGLLAAASSGGVFGSIGDGGRKLHLISVRDRAGVDALLPAERPRQWRDLDVPVLHNAVLPRIGFEETPDTISFIEDEEEALEAVESGEWPHAFLLNGTRVDQIIAVAEAGERMPQKSTYFYPKLGSGIVLYPLD